MKYFATNLLYYICIKIYLKDYHHYYYCKKIIIINPKMKILHIKICHDKITFPVWNF